MRILTIGDLHARDGNPLGRTDNYKEAIFRKLEGIHTLAVKYEAKHTVFLGDIFDQKRGARVSDNLRQRLITWFNAWPGEVWVVPGNHDMGMKGIESLGNQPLGTVVEGSDVRLLELGAPILCEEGSTLFAPRPYDEKRDADPTYYSMTPEEHEYQDAGYLVVMLAHGSILGPGDSRPYPFVDWADIEFRPDILVDGHIHENLGIHTNEEGQAFYNSGSIGRTARTQANMLRKVQVGLIDTDTKKIELLDVPGVAPAEEVFEGKGPVSEAEVNDDILDFVNRVGEGIRAEQLSIDELLGGLDVDQDVKTLIKRLLEASS